METQTIKTQTEKEAARQAAKAAYAQSITKAQLKTDIEAQAWRQPWERADEGTTPGGVKIFNKVERDELRKTEAFKKRNALWNSPVSNKIRYTFGSPKRIGNMTEIIARLRPKTLPDFIAYYTTNIMGWDQIEKLANEFYLYVKSKGFDITPEEALAEHIIHTIDQTWEGWEREEAAAIQLRAALGVEIGRPKDVVWDTDFGIDLCRVDPDARDGFTEGYQVKPRSFFVSDRPGVKWARAQNAAKHMKAEALGKKAWFVDGDALALGKLCLIHWSKI